MIAAIAERQAGVVAVRQLTTAGIGRGAIEHRVRQGRLHFRHRGVYSVGHKADPPLAREFAAVLAYGDDALIGRRSAAAVWGFLRPSPDEVDVVIPGRRVRAHPGTSVHRTELLHRADVRRYRNLPLTSPARTQLDLASELALDDLERALDEAFIQRLLTPAAIQDVLRRHPRYRGSARLGALIKERPALTQQEAERRFRALVRKARLPPPQGKIKILGYEVDYCWPEQRLVVEIDGYQFHSTRLKFESDRERDARLQAAGYRVVRFTWRQLLYEEAVILFRLGQLMPL